MRNECLALLLFPFALCAQLPETDLWLLDIKNVGGKMVCENGRNITKRAGYDNQPVFLPDAKKIFYVSIREDKQADIYSYEISSQKIFRITNTSESEYSPTPNKEQSRFHSVVVERDSTQRIWEYDLKTGKAANFIFNEDSVGYFSFLNSDTVLYYKLTGPHSLRARSLSSGRDVFIAQAIARGFKAVGRSEFVFAVKEKERMVCYRYDAVIKKATLYGEYPGQGEDLVWHQEWGLLRSEGAQILRFEEKEKKWTMLFDLSVWGIKKITRFAFDPLNKRMVVVDNT